MAHEKTVRVKVTRPVPSPGGMASRQEEYCIIDVPDYAGMPTGGEKVAKSTELTDGWLPATHDTEPAPNDFKVETASLTPPDANVGEGKEN